MSQRSYTARTRDGRVVNVLMGWDRPTQCYFLIVALKDLPEDKPVFLYSYLEEEDPSKLSVDDYVDRLKGLGITVPVDMLEAVWLDGLFNEGNRVVVYDEDGTVVS
jgi:hypothetical protein